MSEERMVRLFLDASTAHRERGDVQRARDLLEEARQLLSRDQQPRLEAALEASLGVVARENGDLESAREHLTAAVDLRRGLGDPYGIARALADLARVDLKAGRESQAGERIDEALRVSGGLEPGRTRAEVLEHAGLVHQVRGDSARARECLDEAFTLYERLGDKAACLRVRASAPGGTSPAASPGLDAVGLDEELLEIEKRRLLEALDAEKYNQSRAARRLHVTETRVRNLMRRHGITPRNPRGRPRKEE